MEKMTWSDDNFEKASFNPSRLTLARERRGLTKQGLADECSVTRRTVTAWEAGSVEQPPTDLIAKVLDFPEAFFYADDPAVVAPDSVSFRALSSMSARQLHRVLATSSFAIELSTWMDSNYKTPSVDIPDLSETGELDPVSAADTLRELWSIHEAPVKNVHGLLERKGVRIFALPANDREVDAFSFWREDRPFAFINTFRSGERKRFDLAHELGHLVLHRLEILRRGRELEQQAQDFASSFLMPADSLYSQVLGSPSFEDMLTLKKYWRVSAVAMTHRLSQLGIISEWTYRTWMIELSRRGFRTSEPDGMHPETSKLLGQLLRLAREDGWTSRDIANTLHIPESELNSMMFGLSMSAAPTNVRIDNAEHFPMTRDLRRVK